MGLDPVVIAAGAGTAALAAVGASYLIPAALRFRQTQRLGRQLRHERILALTYDDGPSPVVTSEILSLLKSYNAPATFFMIGRHAERYPAIASKVIAEGHEVGCHSYGHLNQWKCGSSQGVKDITEGYEALRRWVRSDGLFRPPFGKMTLSTYLAVRRRGAKVAWWTHDSGDSFDELPSPHPFCERIQRDGGGIVLMHDLDRSAPRNEFVLEITRSLLELSARERIRLVRLSEVIT